MTIGKSLTFTKFQWLHLWNDSRCTNLGIYLSRERGEILYCISPNVLLVLPFSEIWSNSLNMPVFIYEISRLFGHKGKEWGYKKKKAEKIVTTEVPGSSLLGWWRWVFVENARREWWRQKEASVNVNLLFLGLCFTPPIIWIWFALEAKSPWTAIVGALHWNTITVRESYILLRSSNNFTNSEFKNYELII